MESVKQALHSTIELLGDEEARQILEFARRLREKDAVSPTLRRLANDPTFRIPSMEKLAFRVVQPIEGKGIAASRLLVEDRR